MAALRSVRRPRYLNVLAFGTLQEPPPILLFIQDSGLCHLPLPACGECGEERISTTAMLIRHFIVLFCLAKSIFSGRPVGLLAVKSTTVLMPRRLGMQRGKQHVLIYLPARLR